MGQLMDDIIHTAHSYTVNFKDQGPFDYSIESLKRVDDHLDDLGDYDLDEDALDSISSMVGCYVFETARRNYGGEYRWSEEQQPILIGGLPDFFVSLRAWEKVRERLLELDPANRALYPAERKKWTNQGWTRQEDIHFSLRPLPREFAIWAKEYGTERDSIALTIQESHDALTNLAGGRKSDGCSYPCGSGRKWNG